MPELNMYYLAVRKECLAAFFVFGYDSYPFYLFQQLQTSRKCLKYVASEPQLPVGEKEIFQKRVRFVPVLNMRVSMRFQIARRIITGAPLHRKYVVSA
jgi:hypothetical protein